MPLETDADRQAMLAALGDAVTIGGHEVTALCENSYAEELGISGTRPTLLCLASAAAAAGAARGVAVVVPDVGSFTIISVKPDGTGLATLTLEDDS